MINFKEAVTEFDKEHIVKQIILIGEDGKVKNIEFDNEVEE